MASFKAATAAGGLLLAAGAAGGVVYITQPKPLQQHRAFNDGDSAHMRDRQGRPVPAESNPGARVEPSFVTPEEAVLLVSEAREMMREYGCSHLDRKVKNEYERQAAQVWGGGRPNPNVNMRRVTGRFEREEQRIAPWKYGDEFDSTKAPPTIRLVMQVCAAACCFGLVSVVCLEPTRLLLLSLSLNCRESLTVLITIAHRRGTSLSTSGRTHSSGWTLTLTRRPMVRVHSSRLEHKRCCSSETVPSLPMILLFTTLSLSLTLSISLSLYLHLSLSLSISLSLCPIASLPSLSTISLLTLSLCSHLTHLHTASPRFSVRGAERRRQRVHPRLELRHCSDAEPSKCAPQDRSASHLRKFVHRSGLGYPLQGSGPAAHYGRCAVLLESRHSAGGG